MKYFVQLKDNVVFAYHESPNEIDTPGDNIIEVGSNGRSYLRKKYVNGEFIDAPVIKYAILDSNNTVIDIKETIYSSEVTGQIIDNTEVKVLWTWDGNQFVSPAMVQALPTITFGGAAVTTSELAPAMTEEQYAEQQANLTSLTEDSITE
jgi:hypothetical protein